MRFAALTLLLLTAGPAASEPTDSRLCDIAATSAADAWGIPSQVLLGITRIETGKTRNGKLDPWPWTINLDGQGHWFDSAEAAITFAQAQIAAGNTNFDVGCFQINLSWHKDAFASLEEAFDPTKNAAYAASFLSSLAKTEGNWRDATAAYHSKTPEFAQQYIARIEPILRDLVAAPPQQEPELASLERPRPNTFPLLQGGSLTGKGSLMPMLAARQPLIAERP